MAGSESRWCETGSTLPQDGWTAQTVSSTDTNCGPGFLDVDLGPAHGGQDQRLARPSPCASG